MVISVKNLSKKFGTLKAVDNISFDVIKGEIFGLLGPNGAGKTTTIRMLAGVLKPDKGSAHVAGYDIVKQPLKAKQLMGIVPEMANAYIDLSAYKNLVLMGELYGINKRKTKADKLLRLFGLYEKKNQKVKKFSKGMKQRVIIAMALMNDSEVLFLDEPTSGLDVESTRLIRDLIKKFNTQGKTIILTTHNIEEANDLCDRVAIMNHARIVAVDRPEELKQTIQSTASIQVSFKDPVTDIDFAKAEKYGDKFRIYTDSPEEVIPKLVEFAEKTNNKIISINTFGPSLEDVFVKLTK